MFCQYFIHNPALNVFLLLRFMFAILNDQTTLKQDAITASDMRHATTRGTAINTMECFLALASKVG